MESRTLPVFAVSTRRVKIITYLFNEQVNDRKVVDRLNRKIGLVLFAFSAIYILISLFFSTHVLLSRVTLDDSFYYIVPALNFWEVGYTTFDGINRTNGYQPLWMMVLIVIAGFVSDPMIFLRLALLVSGAFNILSMVIMFKTLRLLEIRHPLLFTTLFGFVLLGRQMAYNGLETTLVWVLLLAAVYYLVRVYRSDSLGNTVVMLSIISPLIVLARLDLVLLIPIIPVLLALHSRKISLKFFYPLLTGLFVFLSYLSYNKLVFSHFMPISGAAKFGAFDIVSSLLNFVYTPVYLVFWMVHAAVGNIVPLELQRSVLGVGLVQFVLLIAFLAVLSVSLFGRKTLRRMLRNSHSWVRSTVVALRRDALGYKYLPLFVAFAFLCFHSAIFAMRIAKGHSFYSTWHHVPVLATMVFVLIFILDALRRKNVVFKSIVFAIIVVFFVNTVVLLIAGLTEPLSTCVDDERDSCLRIDIIHAARSVVPQDARIGAWSAGEIGFLMPDHTVTNLDCLINNFECLKYRIADDQITYIRNEDIRYIIDVCDIPFFDDQATVLNNSRYCIGIVPDN